MLSVIKFGGSLTGDKYKIKKIFISLEYIYDYQGINFLVVPGGGRFADLAMEYYDTHGLPLKISHDISVLSMDQTGLMISNYTKIPTSYKLKKNSILLPSKFLLSENIKKYLKKEKFKLLGITENKIISNKTTSDSIAVYIADLMKAEEVVLLKSVDGITDNNGRLLEKIKTYDLEKIKTDVVDENLPYFLKKYKKKCVIINGLFPERIIEYYKEKKLTGTEISRK